MRARLTGALFSVISCGFMKEKIFFSSLGCDKNTVDSEMMLGILSDAGYVITDDETQADVAIVNTCCFIGDAKEESINTLIELGNLKQEGNLKVLVATGCLAQRYREEIHRDLPEVDAILGTASFDEVAKVVGELLAQKPAKDVMKSIQEAPICGKKRIATNGGHYAYLKIAEGCDKHCTYCVIPSVRGPYRSVPKEILIEEAKQLAENGVKELILVAQETTRYGIDLYGKKSLAELVKELCMIEGLAWIRILYCYPEEMDEDLIEVIATQPKVCHYLDLPMQHASDAILKRMGRQTNQEELRSLVDKLRTRIPDMCIRTTFIVGFPGETEEDFRTLYDFVDTMEFDRVGVFTYSAEEGTPAAAMENQVPAEMMEERRAALMELQQEVAFEKAAQMEGRDLLCMVEGRIPEEGIVVCRSYKDAPDVDGYVFVESDKDLMSGTMMQVQITGSDEYDLIGGFTDEFTE